MKILMQCLILNINDRPIYLASLCHHCLQRQMTGQGALASMCQFCQGRFLQGDLLWNFFERYFDLKVLCGIFRMGSYVRRFCVGSLLGSFDRKVFCVGSFVQIVLCKMIFSRVLCGCFVLEVLCVFLSGSFVSEVLWGSLIWRFIVGVLCCV